MRKFNKKKRVHFSVRSLNKGRRLRLSVHKTNDNIYAQIIDDSKSLTLVYANSLEKEFNHAGYNVNGAKEIGLLIGQRAKEKGITEVVFDRGEFKYHGRIKSLADGARQYLKI